MSEAAKASAGPNTLQQPVPAWIGAGLIGLVLGAGGTLLVMKAYAKSSGAPVSSTDGVVSSPASTGGPPGMGGGPMGGGMGGGGGGGGPRGKRNLSSLVGKLELLTRETLHVELNAEQTAKIADQLAKLDQAEKMTADDAQSQLEALEALLTPEQKAIADSISLPFARPGGGGGPGGGGPGGGGPGGGSPGGPGAGGGADDENPFRQEANQKRLRDLLARIQPAGFEPAKKEPAKSEPAPTEPAKSEPAKSDAADKK